MEELVSTLTQGTQPTAPKRSKFSAKRSSKKAKGAQRPGLSEEDQLVVVEAMLAPDMRPVYKKRARAPVALMTEKAISMGLGKEKKNSIYSFIRKIFRNMAYEEDIVSELFSHESSASFMEWFNKEAVVSPRASYVWKKGETPRASAALKLSDTKEALISELSNNE